MINNELCIVYDFCHINFYECKGNKYCEQTAFK